jgi:hypothetical protein
MQIEEARRPALLPLVLALFSLIAAFHLGGAWLGKPLYRGSHLGTALEYAQGSIDLLRPVIVGFNATGTPTAMEFPLWQAAAAVAFKLAHSTWYGWANLVSLLLFATCLWPLHQLARRYVGERAAWWTVAFFLAEPLIVVMAGEAATDGLCLVASIWFVFCADTLIRTGSGWWWWPTAVCAILSAVLKLPFFFAAGLFSVMLLLANGARAWRPWLLLAGAGAVTGVVFALWSRYTDSLAAQAQYSTTELRLSQSPWLVHWFFGSWHERLSPGPWIKGGWRFLHATLGALPLLVLPALALFRPGNRLPKLWLLATVITTLVFTHLVLEHWHYYLMCCPAVAMLCGATVARWEDFWAREMPIALLRAGLAGVVLVGGAIDGVVAMKIAIDYDYFPQEMSELIRQHTEPDDRIILYTCDPVWGGEMLFRAGRKGLCVTDFKAVPNGAAPKGVVELVENADDLKQLRSLGYNKLVLVSESPVRFAVTAANPGSKRQRAYYPERISPTADAWPDVWRSPDILIKKIP